jgi:hypothetical protein
MPLVYQQDINEHTKIGVWRLLEPESFFQDLKPLVAQINHPIKRLQHLAGRYLLKVLDPNFPIHHISISPTKKPFLQDGSYHFSISHAGDYVAVLISKNSTVGMDIELPRSTIELVKNKFLSQQDCMALAALPLDVMHQYTVAWCVKEAVFKWYGEGSVDYKKHIQISRVTEQDGYFFVHCLFDKLAPSPLVVQVFFLDGYCLSWVCEKK